MRRTTECRRCLRPISRAVRFCPQCGQRNRCRKKFGYWFLFPFIIVALMFMARGTHSRNAAVDRAVEQSDQWQDQVNSPDRTHVDWRHR